MGAGLPDSGEPGRDPARDRRLSFALLAVSALAMGAVAAARPMVSYAALAIHAPTVALGVIASAFALVPVVAAIPLGRWMDRFGAAPFLAGGTFLIAISCLLVPWLASVPGLAADQIVLGLGQVQVAIAAQALIARRVAPHSYDGAFGWFTVAVSLGQLVGPLTAGLLIGEGQVGLASLVGPFRVAGGAGLIGLGLAAAIWLHDRRHPAPAASRRPDDGPAGLPAGSRRARLGRVGPVLLVSSSLVVTADALSVYLPALALQRGIAGPVVGALLSVRAGASMLSRLALGRLARRLGRRRLLMGSLAISGLGLAALPLVADPPIMAILMVGTGLGLGIGQPLTMSWIARDAIAGRQGAALAMRISANRVGQLIAPATLGVMASIGGVPVVFWALAVLLYSAGGLAAPVSFESAS
ncbi:MAG: MFS transporter [Chloroflexi bacterium]|nr:MFS transporter [Chloroflexota bacterium]